MEKKNDQLIDIKHLVRTVLRHWLLFALVIGAFVITGIVYLKIASRTFMVNSKILINVEERRSSGSQGDLLDVNELMNQNRSLQNEIVFLRSTPLVLEVIEDMNLVTTYYMQEGRVPIPRELVFTLTDIYKQSPFIVVIDEQHVQPLNTVIYVGINDDETFSLAGMNENATIYDFKNQTVVSTNTNFNISGVFRFGETVQNEHCSFRILLNSKYNPAQFDGKELFFQLNSPASLAARFRNNLFIEIENMESSMVNLSLVWSNAELASEFLTRLIDKYIEKDLIAKNRLANNTIEFIDQQLANISGSLGRSEEELQNFRSRYDVMSIDEKTRTLSNQMYELGATKEELESDLRTLLQVQDYFEANKDAPNFVAPSLLGIEDEVLNTLLQEMSRLVTEKQDLISKNQLKNPRLKTLEQNIANIKGVISDNLTLLISSASDDLEVVDNRITAIDQEYSRLPRTQRRLAGLEREFNITDAAYTALLNKRIEAQIARASNESDCEIIEPVGFVGVTSPNPLKVIALAIALGLFFPMIYILVKVFLTDKISNQDELERISQIKQVGAIPHAEKKSSQIIDGKEQSPISESFHTLRSNIIYYLLGETGKVILITSAIPNEGKSFISLNLATSFASTHNKTILLSFDMRKGSDLFDEIKENGKGGISAYLINQAPIEDTILTTGIPNLDYMDNGAIPPNPVSLISSRKTKELFDYLKKKYDYIIVDSPPYDVFTDSFLLMGQAELKVFVSRIGVITRKAFRSSTNDIQIKGIEDVYLAVNDVKNIKESKYSYYREGKKTKGLRRLLRRKRRKTTS